MDQSTPKSLERYFEHMARNGRSPGRLGFYLQYLFRGLDLCGKTMLDVGAGNGVYSFYAASAGAARVVSLEPESAGSAAGAAESFEATSAELRLAQVELVRKTLQEYEPQDVVFDVVLMAASINHLDEDACVRLHEDQEARNTYVNLFRKLAGASVSGATLIAVDCSRRNLFADLGLPNPLVPEIEWHKHQPPRLWARLLIEAGFANPRIRWSSFNRLGRVGRVILGNRVAAYILTSTFLLEMDKP